MTAFYIILKISALIAIIIIPLVGPKKKKSKSPEGLSAILVNENGCLEYFNNVPSDHHPVN
jgi:hypothetical protein